MKETATVSGPLSTFMLKLHFTTYIADDNELRLKPKIYKLTKRTNSYNMFKSFSNTSVALK